MFLINAVCESKAKIYRAHFCFYWPDPTPFKISRRLSTDFYVAGPDFISPETPVICLYYIFSATCDRFSLDALSCSMANCQYGCDVVKGEVRCRCPSPGLQLGPDGRTCVGKLCFHLKAESIWKKSLHRYELHDRCSVTIYQHEFQIATLPRCSQTNTFLLCHHVFCTY